MFFKFRKILTDMLTLGMTVNTEFINKFVPYYLVLLSGQSKQEINAVGREIEMRKGEDRHSIY